MYGTTSGTRVDGSGSEIVLSGGSATGLVVDSGGFAFIAGGASLGAATLSGGLVEVASGAVTGAAAITFVTSGGGLLTLRDSQHFAGTVAGFGQPDEIDLTDVAFGSGTTLAFQEAGNNQSGTLTVSSGTQVANLTLLGQYVAAQFHIAGDGQGGTLVTDPPLAPSPLLANPHTA